MKKNNTMKKATPIIIIIAALITGACNTGDPQHEGIVFPEECMVENGGAVIDITRPPYNADNTGKEDVTALVIRAIDDVTGMDRELMKRTIQILDSLPEIPPEASEIPFNERQRMAAENPESILGFERRSGTFPYRNPLPRIIYFPDGIYKVSNTITYSYTDLVNKPGKELNRMIHFLGQSRVGTIIQLEANSPGYGEGMQKPVVSFTSGNMSNVSMQNSIENMSIEIGPGNPGAVGLEFFSNNTGAVRHVTVRSCDPEMRGRAGIAIYTWNSSCALIQDVLVEGCDYGIEIREHRLYTVLEHATLYRQRKAGLLLRDHNLAARGIVSDNQVPAVMVKGKQATLSLVDCQFRNGDQEHSAVNLDEGFIFARDIVVEGYGASLSRAGKTVIADGDIGEYISHECPELYPGQKQKSLHLPVEETPEIPWSNKSSDWISVNSCGAAGDGIRDDTEAIRKAMNSGKPVVWFQPGIYLIDGTIDIPSTVQRVNFMYSDLVAGGELQESENKGAFKVLGDTVAPLIIEDLFAFERYFGMHYLIDHAGKRTLVLSDLHTQVGAQYMNSVSGGKVFLENVCATDQFPPYRNCFSFKGQQVWARQLNPERSDPEVLNEGGRLWVLGFKTEKDGTAFLTTSGGETEVLGGIFNISRSAASKPIIVSRDSRVSVFASTTDHRVRPEEWNLRPFIKDIRGDETRILRWNQFPIREDQLIVIPLYNNSPISQ